MLDFEECKTKTKINRTVQPEFMHGMQTKTLITYYTQRERVCVMMSFNNGPFTNIKRPVEFC